MAATSDHSHVPEHQREAAFVIGARLRPPHIDPASMVQRPRIDSAAVGWSDTRVSAVIAPAGYGKTTLISEWAQSDGRLVAWLSLEARDNQPRRFFEHMVAAIGLASGVRQSSPPITTSSISVDFLAQLLLAMMELRTEPLLVVIDDLHYITDSFVLDVLKTLVDYAPAKVSFLLASRTEPPLPLSRWRARGQLLDIRMEDLRFTLDETRELCQRSLDVPLTDDEVQNLVNATEGWAAALRLVILRLRQVSPASVPETLNRLTNGNRDLAVFLEDEVLASFTSTQRTTLERMSLLDKLQDDLCAAVVGDEYESGTLRTLWHGGMLMSALDDEGQWFHLHPVIVRHLNRHLVVSHSAPEIAQLHSRASAWWEVHGDTEAAVDHAIHAGEWDRATRLMTPLITSLEAAHRLDEVKSWFDAFPGDIIRNSAEFSTWYAWILVRTGHLTSFEDHLHNAERLGASHPTILGVVASVRAVAAFYQGNGADCIAHAASALSKLPIEADVERRWAEAALGLGESHTGRSDVARERLEAFRAHGPEYSTMMLDAEVQLCWIHMLQGRASEAEFRLRTLLSDRPTAGTDALRRAQVMLADIFIELGDYAGASRLLTEADERAARFGSYPLLADSRFRWARLFHRVGEFGRALEHLSRMYAEAPFANNARVRSQVQAFMAQIWLSQGKVHLVDAWVQQNNFVVTDDLTFRDEGDYPTFGRWLLHQGRAEDARTIARGMSGNARHDGRIWHLVPHLVLLALAEDQAGDRTSAISTTRQLLGFASQSGHVTTLALAGEPLGRLLREVAAGGEFVDLVHRVEQASRVMESGTRGEPDVDRIKIQQPLSRREMEVLRLIAVGLSNKDISNHLYISVPTVKRHVTNIFDKLDAASRTDAVYKAREHALL